MPLKKPLDAVLAMSADIAKKYHTNSMTHDYKTVLYTELDRIATITLNRADKRNAISYELIDDLIAALKQAAEFISASCNPDRRGQGILLRHGPGQPEAAHRTHARAEHPGFRNHGVTVPDAL